MGLLEVIWDLVVQACREAKVGRSQVKVTLESEFKVSQGHLVGPCLESWKLGLGLDLGWIQTPGPLRLTVVVRACNPNT